MNNLRWEDLVFANRNQAYGAYPLRRTYSSRMSMSFAFAMIFVAMLLCYPAFKSLFKAELVVKPDVIKEDPMIWMSPPPIQVDLPPPPKVHVPVQQIRFVPPVVTPQEVEELPPTIEEIQSQVSDQTINGANLIIETPPVVETPPAEDVNKIWRMVDKQPEFPGGFAEMMKFIGKNIKYPASARRMGVSGSVFISFVVNADGTIDGIETLKGIYADCDNEAMRVIAKMPTWKPGVQNGKAVRVRFVLPIKFALTNM